MTSHAKILAGAIAVLATLLGAAGSAAGGGGAGGSDDVDPTALPLGDGKVTTTGARRGYVYRCGPSGGMGGAFAAGPWINTANGTWDSTAKATVDGTISWPAAAYSEAVNGATRTIVSTGLPVGGTTGIFPIASTDDAFAYDRNPNSIRSVALNLALAARPSKGAGRCLTGGPIAIAINGVAIYDALDAGGNDAVAHEIQDSCGGHPQMTGQYHYHALPKCLDAGKSAKKHSKLVGFAVDGFPLYGYRGEDGERLENEDLDSCHGHSHMVKLDGKLTRIYHYHATREYPYTLGCFRG